MELEGAPGQRLITYYAEPGTAEYDATVLLDMLAPDNASHRRVPGDGPSASAPNGAAAPSF